MSNHFERDRTSRHLFVVVQCFSNQVDMHFPQNEVATLALISPLSFTDYEVDLPFDSQWLYDLGNRGMLSLFSCLVLLYCFSSTLSDA